VLDTDADLPFETIELVRAVRVLRTYEADIVSAYPFDRTGEGPRRAVYSWVYNWLIHAMFGTRVRDINFVFKLCRRRAVELLVVTADDLDLTDGVCRAVHRGHVEGIVTATSLLAVGRAFDAAAAMLRDTPTLDLGPISRSSARTRRCSPRARCPRS